MLRTLYFVVSCFSHHCLFRILGVFKVEGIRRVKLAVFYRAICLQASKLRLFDRGSFRGPSCTHLFVAKIPRYATRDVIFIAKRTDCESWVVIPLYFDGKPIVPDCAVTPGQGADRGSTGATSSRNVASMPAPRCAVSQPHLPPNSSTEGVSKIPFLRASFWFDFKTNGVLLVLHFCVIKSKQY